MKIFDNFNFFVKKSTGVFLPDLFTIESINNSVVVSEKNLKGITSYTTGVNSIANSIASIPFKLRKNKEIVKNDLYFLIKEKPNNFQTSYQFFRQMINGMMYRGTAFALIKRNENTGEITSLIPLPFESVGEAKIVDGELYYIIDNVPISNDDLLVFKNSGTGPFGTDPLKTFADTLGITLSANRYTKRTFEGDGSNIKGVITSENTLKEEQKENFRKSIQANYTGSNSKSLLVLDKGFDFKPVSLSPDQLKLIETRNIQVAEIARILNVPIFIVASEIPSNYNSIEGQQLDFYKRTLSPIIYMIELELKHKLLTRSQINDDYYFKGAIESLLRGDSKSRAEFYKELFYLSALSPEEIRELEDMPSKPTGETYVQANLIPTKLIGEFYESKINADNAKFLNNNNNE